MLWFGGEVVMKMDGWWRFFQKPVGLELVFFVNPELIFATFFFYFLFFASEEDCRLEVGFFGFGVGVVL